MKFIEIQGDAIFCSCWMAQLWQGEKGWTSFFTFCQADLDSVNWHLTITTSLLMRAGMLISGCSVKAVLIFVLRFACFRIHTHPTHFPRSWFCFLN